MGMFIQESEDGSVYINEKFFTLRPLLKTKRNTRQIKKDIIKIAKKIKGNNYFNDVCDALIRDGVVDEIFCRLHYTYNGVSSCKIVTRIGTAIFFIQIPGRQFKLNRIIIHSIYLGEDEMVSSELADFFKFLVADGLYVSEAVDLIIDKKVFVKTSADLIKFIKFPPFKKINIRTISLLGCFIITIK